MEAHGEFRIWCEQRVLFVVYLGTMNEETGERLGAEYIRVATPLAGAPWAACIDLSDFHLGTPGTTGPIARARQWAYANGLAHQATVTGGTGAEILHRKYLNQNAPAGFVARYFDEQAAARAWLRELRYLD